MLLLNALANDELKNQIDYKYYSYKILQNSVINTRVNTLHSKGNNKKIRVLQIPLILLSKKQLLF